MLEDDPVLGPALANYPSNRARLLLIGAAVLGVIWFVITVVLLPVEAGVAATITISVLGLVTLVIGWYISHLWNREVVLYKQGFSYREGSFIAYIRYDDVASLRQRAERVSYFGGLVRRTIYRSILKTAQDETIILNNVYKRMDELGVRLEQQIYAVLRPVIVRALAKGESVPFADTLTLNAQGLHDSDRHLAWPDFGGYKIQSGRLLLFTQSGETWFSAPLAEVDNITVLLDLLKQREPAKAAR
jgi:hypothetical protein